MSSVGSVDRIIIISNQGSYVGTIATVTAGPVCELVYELQPPVQPNQYNITFPLSDAQGLQDGDQFTARVTSNQGGVERDSNTVTYIKSSPNAAYYNLTDGANAPVIKLDHVGP